jgi:hypothetical protein
MQTSRFSGRIKHRIATDDDGTEKREVFPAECKSSNEAMVSNAPYVRVYKKEVEGSNIFHYMTVVFNFPEQLSKSYFKSMQDTLSYKEQPVSAEVAQAQGEILLRLALAWPKV